MTTVPLGASARRRLDRAATLLYSAGRNCPVDLDPGIQIECLYAADQLACLGARPDRRPVAEQELAATIRQALTELAALPARLHEQPAVLAGAEAGRQALYCLTG